MTIAEIMKAVEAPLKSWADANKAGVQICGDRVRLLSGLYRLSRAPGKTQLYLIALAGQNRSLNAEYAREDLRLQVIVTRGFSFSLDNAESLMTGSAGAKPLFDVVEEVREVVRGIRLPEPADEPMIGFTGFSIFDTGTWLLDAYQLDFTVARDLPDQPDASEAE